ncbi:hypothetical protein ACIOJE_29050 [Kitasatospora sp. NPDC087861]|uniref:hypothetical protein n=1 Tax=Kitasatospora sp. NPDC087861 TaxID=3364070 RepID=UPI0037F94678
MADIEPPADLLSLHVAALQADRAMTAVRLAGGDVEAYIGAAEDLRTHPIWEQARAEGKHQKLLQASLDAAKRALDDEQA